MTALGAGAPTFCCATVIGGRLFALPRRSPSCRASRPSPWREETGVSRRCAAYSRTLPITKRLTQRARLSTPAATVPCVSERACAWCTPDAIAAPRWRSTWLLTRRRPVLGSTTDGLRPLFEPAGGAERAAATQRLPVRRRGAAGHPRPHGRHREARPRRQPTPLVGTTAVSPRTPASQPSAASSLQPAASSLRPAVRRKQSASMRQ